MGNPVFHSLWRSSGRYGASGRRAAPWLVAGRQAEGLRQAVGQGAETRVLGGGVAVARCTTHRLVVELMDHHVVEQQRAQISQLQEELAALKLSYNRLEFSYGCTVSMLSQVTDYCQDHDFRLPKRLLDDPRKLFPASVSY